MLTAERLRELLSYDESTGQFRWRGVLRAHRAGKLVGEPDPRGYCWIGVERRIYYAHRLAWLYVHGTWPVKWIDHINGNPSDNRISNLRAATPAQNQANGRGRKNNTSGFRGVSWCRRSRKWVAHIRINGKQTRLGLFDNASNAGAVYEAKAIELYGEFAKTRMMRQSPSLSETGGTNV